MKVEHALKGLTKRQSFLEGDPQMLAGTKMCVGDPAQYWSNS
jgi:hypothetical protein